MCINVCICECATSVLAFNVIKYIQEKKIITDFVESHTCVCDGLTQWKKKKKKNSFTRFCNGWQERTLTDRADRQNIKTRYIFSILFTDQDYSIEAHRDFEFFIPLNFRVHSSFNTYQRKKNTYKNQTAFGRWLT